MNSANAPSRRPKLGEPVRSSRCRPGDLHHFRVSGSQVHARSGSPKDAHTFMSALEQLHHHALILGEQLGMSQITHGVQVDPSYTIAFRFQAAGHANEDVLGLSAAECLRCSEALSELKGLEA